MVGTGLPVMADTRDEVMDRHVHGVARYQADVQGEENEVISGYFHRRSCSPTGSDDPSSLCLLVKKKTGITVTLLPVDANSNVHFNTYFYD